MNTRSRIRREEFGSISSVALIMFFIYAPTLLSVPLSSFLPKLTFLLLSLYYFVLGDHRIIRLSLPVIILCLNSLALIFSLLIGNSDLIFPLLAYSIMFMMILAIKGFPERVAESALFNRRSALADNCLSMFFLILPASIVAQYLYPPLFDTFGHFIVYDADTIAANLDEARYSGFISGVGAGATTVLACLLILFLVNSKARTEKLTHHFSWLSLFIGTTYIVAMALTGSTGYILVGIFFVTLYASGFDFTVSGFLKQFAVALSFLGAAYLLVTFGNLQGLEYINVFFDEGWQGLSDYRSIRPLMAYYEYFSDYLKFVLTEGGLSGSPNAITRYDITDVGILNEIHVVGIIGFVLFNFFLACCAGIGLSGLIGQRRNLRSTYSYAGLFSTAIYSMLFQFKEFMGFQTTGTAALIIVLLLYCRVLRREDSTPATAILNVGSNPNGLGAS